MTQVNGQSPEAGFALLIIICVVMVGFAVVVGLINLGLRFGEQRGWWS